MSGSMAPSCWLGTLLNWEASWRRRGSPGRASVGAVRVPYFLVSTPAKTFLSWGSGGEDIGGVR